MRVSKVNSNETGADKKVGSILNLLLREGGVPAGGGGRWIHKLLLLTF